MLHRNYALATVALASFVLAMTDAEASAQRTFVASYGNDANVCSLTQPCRGFAAAITQTISGGEVIALDSAGYGPVTITQSVSIIAPAGVYAGISTAQGVTIHAPNIKVALRGLTINNTSANGAGYGIYLEQGVELSVESCVISNFYSVSFG